MIRIALISAIIAIASASYGDAWQFDHPLKTASVRKLEHLQLLSSKPKDAFDVPKFRVERVAYDVAVVAMRKSASIHQPQQKGFSNVSF